MEISNYTKIIELTKDKINENNLCFDCLKDSITCVSINNGVFLCNNCSSAHKMIFTDDESHIILLDDKYIFSDDDYSYMIKGGNKRYKLFLSSYNIDIYNFNNIPLKYTSRASYFYRDLLKCEIKGEIQNSVKPSIEEGKKLLFEGEEEIKKEEEETILKNIENLYEKGKDSIINTKDELLSDYKSGKLKENVKSSIISTSKFISESTLKIGDEIKNIFSSFSDTPNSISDYDICFEKVYKKIK